MRATFLSVLFTFSIICQTIAQSTGKIQGRITLESEETEALTGATVTLMHAKDSSTVKTAATGKKGVFAFEGLEMGSYFVIVTATGHRKAFSPLILLSSEQPTAALAPIPLLRLAKSLGGVTVSAQKPPIEQRVDRTVLNVEATPSNIGSTALEILEKAPGVTVDKDGNIALKGKDGVLVLIDGRPTQLGGADLANLLRTMNASQMEQIEIMTNPPARYDAAGNAGIINIKTKKNKLAGYNGSFSTTYTQGRYASANEGFTFNIREGKINVFSNLSHAYRKNFQTLDIQRRLRHPVAGAIQNYFDQEGKRIADGNSYNAKVGLDFFATKKTTIGAVISGMNTHNSLTNRNINRISSSGNELQSVTRATVRNTPTFQNLSTNLNFRRLLDAKGKELTADLDYMAYDLRNEQFMVNAYFDAMGNSTEKNDTLYGMLPQHIKIYTGRLDYLQPIKKDVRFEAGIKSTIVTTDNNVGYDSIQYGTVVHDYNRSNHFVYEEIINAAYANLSTLLSKKISAQFGLRLEHTNTNGKQVTTGQKFDRNYTQIFPTAFFQYKADEKNNFGLNYARRLRRPDYGSLNPFIRFIDRYTYSQGNPNLKPQFSHNIELTHIHKNFLTTTLNYTSSNNIIHSVIEQKGEQAYSTPANIASLQQFGLSVSANKSFTKWWTSNLYGNVYHNRFSGMVSNASISFSATTLQATTTQQFKLSKTGTAEISGAYYSGGVEGVMKIKPRSIVSFGYSQALLKNKGTLRLTVRDIFYQQIGRVTTRYGNVDATFQQARDSRVVALGFTYRFSKGKVSSPRKRQAGTSEEESRIDMD